MGSPGVKAFPSFFFFFLFMFLLLQVWYTSVHTALHSNEVRRKMQFLEDPAQSPAVMVMPFHICKVYVLVYYYCYYILLRTSHYY